MAKVRLRGFKKRIQEGKEEIAAANPVTNVELPWKISEGPQKMAAESGADEVFFGGAAGGGKDQAVPLLRYREDFLRYNGRYPDEFEIPETIIEMETKILSQSGWVNLSDIKVGDRIMNPDGSPQAVLKVIDNGVVPIYRVTFEDNTSALVGAGHLWGYWIARSNPKSKSHRKNGGGVRYLTGDWNQDYIVRGRIGTTLHLKEHLEAGRHVITPICAPQRLARPVGRNRTMNPYLLGVLLGDGMLTKVQDNTLTFCKPLEDEAIANRLRSEGLQVELGYVDYPDETNNYTKPFACWNVIDESSYVAIGSYGLSYKRSWEKFIPTYYLWAPLEIREAVAQGLMDTDGYVDENGRHVEYCTTSRRLADDAAHLFRSLGYMVRIHIKPEERIINEDGSESVHREAYRLMIQGNDIERLFSLPRKKERCRPFNGGVSWAGRRVKSIEYECDEQSRCIVVNNPNHLYITDDFIVTHNSALLLLLAATQHRRSIIFRRVYPNLKGMIEKSKELLRGVARYNSTDKMWRGIPGDRILEFGAMEYEEDREKYRGQEHDGKFYDELSEFTQSQFEFTSAWNRTTIPGQHCKVVATFNPPSSRKGAWIIKKLAPWLDANYRGEPAAPGELRWFIRDRETNEDVEVPNGDLLEYKGELLKPRSRTFIPASLDDNPYLKDSGYRAMLQSLPEPLRSQLLYGKFDLTDDDHQYQVIPSEWVRAAQKRWVERKWSQPDVMGVDVSRAGKDETIIAGRWEHWIAPLQVHPGESVPNGRILADLITVARPNNRTVIVIDVVGVGSSPYDFLRDRNIPTFGFSGAMAAIDPVNDKILTDKTGVMGFKNMRAYAWWRARDWLDPSNYNVGDAMPELPPDEELFADLTTPRWQKGTVTARHEDAGIKVVIQVEEKDDIKKRLDGRSPDRGDAVVMSLIEWTDKDDPMGWIDNI